VGRGRQAGGPDARPALAGGRGGPADLVVVRRLLDRRFEAAGQVEDEWNRLPPEAREALPSPDELLCGGRPMREPPDSVEPRAWRAEKGQRPIDAPRVGG
jgi:hypothetical protein